MRFLSRKTDMASDQDGFPLTMLNPAMAIPRIGQEVIVEFLDGDINQPIITERVYNRVQLPPYELPKHKTKMTLRSDTHKEDRTIWGYNELSFEDELNQEEVYLRGRRGIE